MGNLTLVTVPIGNLEDITLRAKKALEVGELFFVEDTRSFKELLRKLDISYSNKRIISFHDHSSDEKLESLLSQYEEQHIYCASEAGSPYISDPAYPLVKSALDKGFKLETIPGVSAVTTALELSGLPAIPFTFLGFFPRDTKKQKEVIEKILSQKGTYILFEGVGKAIKTLDFLTKNLPRVSFSVGRELTKLYETTYRFKGEDFDSIKSEIILKGEFTICMGQEDENSSLGSVDLKSKAKTILEKGASDKNVAALLAEILDISKKEIYNDLVKREK